MDEHFICQACGQQAHINHLKKRSTMPGDYCRTCGDEEKCAACGEIYPHSYLMFKNDIKNYVCEDCTHDYQQVLEYIKPLTPFANVGRKAA